MTNFKKIPSEFESVRQAALRALGPVKPADEKTRANKTFLFDGKRSDAGRELPPYYLVYFLLIELLGFQNLGKFEKISWSVPVDYNGKAFLIEHRKFGVGVFIQDPDRDENDAREIVIRIKKAIKAARPFFDWLAEQAIAASELNVVNNSSDLLERFIYFCKLYREKAQDAKDLKGEKIVKEGKSRDGGTWTTITYPAQRLRIESRWLALSAIDAFFSYTEHVFIHIAILTGTATSGEEVAALAGADWPDKYKTAIGVSEPASKVHFDKLVEIRRELRNFVSHGAFGKDGKAFHFHSGAGSLPVVMPHKRRQARFTIGGGLTFDDEGALNVIDEFMRHLWDGTRAPARLYIESTLPVILSMAASGRYAQAMADDESMKQLVEHLSIQFDRAADMDW